MKVSVSLSFLLLVMTSKTGEHKRVLILKVDSNLYNDIEHLHRMKEACCSEKTKVKVTKFEKNLMMKNLLKKAFRSSGEIMPTLGSYRENFSIKILKYGQLEQKKKESQAAKHLKELKQMKKMLEKLDMMMKTHGKWTRV